MSKPDVIAAVMKLSRCMRRGPGLPPAGGGRPLTVMQENPNVTSRELAELLDVRPSSLTEMLSALEKDGLITRTPDEDDRRVSRVSLTAKGEEAAGAIAAKRNAELEKFAACFTDEEAEQFCEMCDRLSAHLESLAAERCREDGFPHEHGHCPGHRGHCGGHHGHHGHGPGPFGGKPPFGPPPFGKPQFDKPQFDKPQFDKPPFDEPPFDDGEFAPDGSPDAE